MSPDYIFKDVKRREFAKDMMRTVILFISLIYSVQGFSQTRTEIMEELKKDRAEMLREISKIFADDSFIQSQLFADVKRAPKPVVIEEKQNNDGSVDLVITPKNKDVSLDISTNNKTIVIKWDYKKKNSSGSQSFYIPEGYIANAPISKGKALIIKIIKK